MSIELKLLDDKTTGPGDFLQDVALAENGCIWMLTNPRHKHPAQNPEIVQLDQSFRELPHPENEWFSIFQELKYSPASIFVNGQSVYIGGTQVTGVWFDGESGNRHFKRAGFIKQFDRESGAYLGNLAGLGKYTPHRIIKVGNDIYVSTSSNISQLASVDLSQTARRLYRFPSGQNPEVIIGEQVVDISPSENAVFALKFVPKDGSYHFNAARINEGAIDSETLMHGDMFPDCMAVDQNGGIFLAEHVRTQFGNDSARLHAYSPTGDKIGIAPIEFVKHPTKILFDNSRLIVLGVGNSMNALYRYQL